MVDSTSKIESVVILNTLWLISDLSGDFLISQVFVARFHSLGIHEHLSVDCSRVIVSDGVLGRVNWDWCIDSHKWMG